MVMPSPDWSRIHRKESFGLWSLPLAILSVPYTVGSRLRPWSFRKGYFKRQALPGFVVSIGNLTAGGTGKTPLTAYLVGEFRRRGWRPGIVRRL